MMDQEDSRALPARGRVALFVERATRQWVLLDAEGKFWILPTLEDPWRHRLPFEPTEDTSLERVPGHYVHVLGLPF